MIPVDQSLLTSATDYLLERRTGAGTFDIVPPVYNPMPDYLVNAYIVYFLSALNVTNLTAEIQYLESVA